MALFMEVITACPGVVCVLICPTRFWAPSPGDKGCTMFVCLQHEKAWHTRHLDRYSLTLKAVATDRLSVLVLVVIKVVGFG